MEKAKQKNNKEMPNKNSVAQHIIARITKKVDNDSKNRFYEAHCCSFLAVNARIEQC